MGLPVQDLVVMIIADQPRSPVAEAAGRARLKPQLQAVEEQYERWIAAVGIENEGYFWRHLKSQGDSTVDLIRGLGTAVNQTDSTAVNGAVSVSSEGDNQLDDDAGSELRASLRTFNVPLEPTPRIANGVLAA
jgi:hypothetical protein